MPFETIQQTSPTTDLNQSLCSKWSPFSWTQARSCTRHCHTARSMMSSSDVTQTRRFSPTSELKISSRRHVYSRQVLSTVDRRPSPVDHTQCGRFLHSTMTTGRDKTRRAVHCCQPRLVTYPTVPPAFGAPVGVTPFEFR